MKKMIRKFAIVKNLIILLLIQFVVHFGVFGQDNSVISEGKWYKISTNTNGIHSINYSDFNQLGITQNDIPIDAIKLYGNGGGMLPKLNSTFRNIDLVENTIQVYDLNGNGIFDNLDYILFYGMSPNVWKLNENTNLFEHKIHLFSDEVYYFLTIDNQTPGKRITEKNIQQNPSKIITNYNSFSNYEKEKENIISSGSKWYGDRFSIDNNQSFEFNFPNLITAEPLEIKIATVARSFQSSSFLVNANSSFLTTLSMPNVPTDYAKEYASEVVFANQFFSNSSNININIQYSSNDSGAEAWLDYIEINARENLRLNSDYIIFRDLASQQNTIGEYRIEDASDSQVWDITNPLESRKMSTSYTSNYLLFCDSLINTYEYIVFKNSASFYKPAFYGEIANQNLHVTQANTEYIIVCHPKFLSIANRLADFHFENDNMISVVVTPQEIYNEFSSGMQDVSAIRDFVKFQYDKQDSELKYLLLFGDGSFDPKDRIQNNTNYIPTYQSENSVHPVYSYVTDDFFGLLDPNEGEFKNDLVDIGVGRFPVSTLSEANILVDKIEQYYKQSSFGSWRNDIAFIADDGDALDANLHMWQSDTLANHIDDNYEEINIQKIYLDNYEQESTPAGPRSEATQNAINNKVDKGALLINFTGHGGPLGWTQERILELEQINNWNNLDNLPLFMTATCKFSYFDDPANKSAGEQLLLNPNGGAIALLSTTRLVYSFPNFNLNKKFIETIFQKDGSSHQRLGDIFKTTKVLAGTDENNRNFTLLGDPALTLAYPKFDVKTTFVNDTLKALSEVLITGYIENDGMLISDFNGLIYATVFDKEIVRTTLGQESCTPMPYRDQNNILYKGAATVKNGEFNISFIVPKDISYNFGNGKISYYAVNDNEEDPFDANGAEENFIIGGTADNIIYDYDPAEISLYMNDTLFKNGGITNSNPILLANIIDVSGINTVGNGIGHDITAVIDGNTNNPFVLNDYYESNTDDFTKGTLRFPLYNIEPGKHTISLKVWDVFNNSSESELDFFVTDDDNFIIDDFISTPNPFSSSTDLYFQHNKSNQDLKYDLNIYSITGKLIKKISEIEYDSQGYRVGPLSWNGRDNNGTFLSPGMYIANLYIESEDGDSAFKSIRIILLPE